MGLGLEVKGCGNVNRVLTRSEIGLFEKPLFTINTNKQQWGKKVIDFFVKKTL